MATIALLLAAPTRGNAQDDESDPTAPKAKRHRIGAEIGFSSVWQSGVFEAGCGRFDVGSGVNPVFALAYDYLIQTNFRLELLLGYQGRSISSTYNSLERVQIKTEKGATIPVDVNFENIGNANFDYVFVLPSLKYYIYKGLYAGVGVSANFLLAASTQYTKKIANPTVNAGDLGTSQVYFPDSASSDPYVKTFDVEPRATDASGFGLDVAGYIGYEVKLPGRWRLGPRLLYTYPISPVFKSPELSLNTFQFLLGVRWVLP